MPDIKKENKFSNYFKVYYLYYLFPICIILGNAAINIFVILLDLIFILYFFRDKNYKLTKFFKISFVIFLFICFKDLIMNDAINFKSVSLVRFLFFVEASLYFLNYEILKKLSNFTFLIIILISIDLFFQYINSTNLLGMYSGEPNRFSGIFGDEWIIGSFFNKIAFILFPLFLFNKKFRYFYIFYFSLLFILILISGERISFISFLLIGTLFFLMNNKKNFKLILSSLITIIITITLLFQLNHEKINNRYNLDTFNKHFKFEIGTQSRLMVYGLKISYDNLFFGVGTNKFKKTCEQYYGKDEFFKKCEEHPHNHLVEILAEQGIFVFILVCYYILKLYYKFFNNIYLYSSVEKLRFIVLSIYFMPFLYSGSIFSTWTATLLSFNLFLVILANRKLNTKI